MNLGYYLVIVLHLLACFFLIGVVLLQQGKSQDLASAFGGGGTQAAFGPRGSANVLTKATAILAGVFVVTSLALSMLRLKSSSVLDRVQTPPAQASPAAGSAPATLPATTVPAPATSPSAP